MAGVDSTARNGRYYPALDGLRTFAVLAVIGYHGAKGVSPGGFIGVDIFFVISGFVITLTLLREHERTGRIALVAFYRRRFWRLTPALLATVVLAVLLNEVLPSGSRRSVLEQALLSVTYTYNIGQVVTDDRGGGILSHMWSLSVEEQFYLCWAPAAAVLFAWSVSRRRRLLVLTIAVAVLFVSGAVTALLLGNLAAFFLPWPRFAQLLVGALLAVALHRNQEGRLGRGLSSPLLAVVAMLVLVAGVLTMQDIFADWLFVGGFLGLSLVSAVVVGHTFTARRGIVLYGLGHPVAVWLGQRSYGLYLYHYPVVVTLRETDLNSSWYAPLSLLGAIVLAGLSYRFLETPLRKRGTRPAHQPAPSGDAEEQVAVSLRDREGRPDR